MGWGICNVLCARHACGVKSFNTASQAGGQNRATEHSSCAVNHKTKKKISEISLDNPLFSIDWKSAKLLTQSHTATEVTQSGYNINTR
jgi:hypothetical protein